jgi:hypothetical protein
VRTANEGRNQCECKKKTCSLQGNLLHTG